MDAIRQSLRSSSASSTSGLLRRLGLSFAAALMRWTDVARQRRMLAQLDDRLLKDIGLSRADVEREAGKRFWID